MAEEQKAEKPKAEKAEKPAKTPSSGSAEGAAPAAEGAAAGATEGAAKEKVKKIKRKTDVQGCCTVKATFNNTIVSITDVKGNVVAWGSPGKVGFKGSRKSTPFAAQVAAESAAQVAIEMGMRKLDVRVKGAGAGRESAIRALKAAGMDILSIKDVTGVPHNGCRPKKRRRV